MTIDDRRAFLAAAAASLCAALLSGCNTVAGVGQDVENLGDKIGDEAREKKRRN